MHPPGRIEQCVCCFAAWSTVIAAATTAYVPVCCNANSTVSIVATAHNRVTKSFSAGPGSYAIALPSAGTAWVTNAGNNTISIVTLATGVVSKTLQLKLQPWLIQASPDGAHVYVVTGMFTGNLSHYSSKLLVFNAETGASTGELSLPNDGLANPGQAVSPDSSRVYATFDSRTILVYDAAGGTVASTWQTSRVLTWTATGTLTLSPDGQTLCTARQAIIAFDTANGSIKGTVSPPRSSRTYSKNAITGSLPIRDVTALTFSPDGSQAYAATDSTLDVIDTSSGQATGTFSLGTDTASALSVTPDGSQVWVTPVNGTSVTIVNTQGGTLQTVDFGVTVSGVAFSLK
jgi:DNA-binding beta-propeller fold protein YncE